MKFIEPCDKSESSPNKTIIAFREEVDCFLWKKNFYGINNGKPNVSYSDSIL